MGYETSSTGTDNSTNVGDPFVLGKPTGTVEGDVLVGIVSFSAGTTPTGPADWTMVAEENTYRKLSMWYKVAGASEPATYSWEPTTLATVRGGIARYSGVNTASVSDATATANSGNSNTPTGTSITTATNGAFLVMAISHAITAADSLALVDMTGEAWDIINFGMHYATQATAGASGAKTATLSSSNLWTTILWALEPAGAGGEAIKQSVNDILQLAESSGKALALRRFSASSLQVGESIKRAMALSRGAAEAVNVAETAGKAAALRRLVAETVNVIEASQAARGLRRAVADTLSIFETSLAQKGLTRSVADVISLAETTGSGIATSIVKAINEALQLAETSLRTLALSRPVAETVQILESVIRPARWLRLVAETVTIAEATKAARALRRFASDVVQIVEATGRTLTQPGVITAIVKNIAETLQLIEARSIAKWPTGRLGIDIRRGYAIIRAVGRLYAAVVQGRQYRARHEK